MRSIKIIYVLILLFADINTTRAQNKELAAGREIFLTYCSRCHGMQGGGGEGPALNRSYLPRASNDTAFLQVIFGGIPGTAMPGSWMLSFSQVQQVIKYVRSLDTVREETVRGNPEKGHVIFQQSKCLSCHSIKANGSSIGPDLAGVGLRRGSNYIHEVLTSPGKQKIKDQEGFIQYLVLEVITKEGKAIRGIRINEDTYTIQMKDLESKWYSFRKDELKSITRSPQSSIMPSFAQTLTNEERQDLVAYLLTQK